MLGQGKTKIILNWSCPQGAPVTFFGENPYFTKSQPDLNITVIDKDYIDWCKEGNKITDIEGYVCVNQQDFMRIVTQQFNKDEAVNASHFCLSYFRSLNKITPYKDDLYYHTEYCKPIYDAQVKHIEYLPLTEWDNLPKIWLDDHAIKIGQYLDSDYTLNKDYVEEFVKERIESNSKLEVWNEIGFCGTETGFELYSFNSGKCLPFNQLYPILDNCLLHSNFTYIKDKLNSFIERHKNEKSNS